VGDRPSDQYILEKTIVNKPPIVAVYVQKPGDPEQRHGVYPSDTIATGDRTLVLTSIVVHLGTQTAGHYIAYIRCQEGWYLFDDIGSKLIDIKVKNIDQYDSYPQICRDASIYVYME
jgi:hypothetical protein